MYVWEMGVLLLDMGTKVKKSAKFRENKRQMQESEWVLWCHVNTLPSMGFLSQVVCVSVCTPVLGPALKFDGS